MRRQIYVRSESDAEMTSRRLNEEASLLNTVKKDIKNLVNSIEMLSDASYEAMELNVLYEECLNTLQNWDLNKRSLTDRM